MRKSITELLLLFELLSKFRRVFLETSLKRRIYRSWLNVFLLNNYDGRNKQAPIVGYHVKFINFPILKFLFNEIFLSNDYQFLADTDSPNIIDCGSNIGLSVLYFKFLYPKARILAFEPGDETFHCLEENVSKNQLDSVSIKKTALSNVESIVDFYYEEGNLGSLRMSTKQDRMPNMQKRNVKTSLLSDYIDEPVDFLKMDIEGSEVEVVEELIKAKKLGYVKQAVIEYHHHLDRKTDSFSKILRLLENEGFGYQIESSLQRPLTREQYQDLLIYAYQK